MIYWLTPGDPATDLSGGIRKLGDLDAILRSRGLPSRLVYSHELPGIDWDPADLVVIPECYNRGLDTLVPHPIRRLSFVQNGYYVDPTWVHAFRVDDLAGVMCSDQHSMEEVRRRCPDLPCPLVRIHLSPLGRMGHDAPFHWGPWPRARRVAYFRYKSEDVLPGLLEGLDLPPGWSLDCLSGRTDGEIAEAMRTDAVFLFPGRREGAAAPPGEAMVSGAIVVGWEGGGPAEFLRGHAQIAPQDDVKALRQLLFVTCAGIDDDPVGWGVWAQLCSTWFLEAYSRRQEIAEVVAILGLLHKGNAAAPVQEPPEALSIETDHPLAVDSVDHQWPSGTMRDNSKSPAFNRKLFALGPPRVLDLGCSGGGMVEAILVGGGFAVGVEGSDYSRKANRAAWATIPGHLFTADATEPFQITREGEPVTFTAVTAWEFLEHIPEERLAGVFANIDRHLEPHGLLIVSVATIPDDWQGHTYHATVRPAEWWVERLRVAGFGLVPELTEYFAPDWVRGPLTGNGSSLCAVLRSSPGRARGDPTAPS